MDHEKNLCPPPLISVKCFHYLKHVRDKHAKFSYYALGIYHRKRGQIQFFCKDIRKIKKELQGVPVSKASAIILKEWKKVKESNKKIKKYRYLYEEEKRRNAEAPQPKKAPKLPKSSEPKKASKSPQFIDDPSEEEKRPKKASGSGDGKKTTTKTGKKVNKTSMSKKATKSRKSDGPKKAPKSPEFVDTDSHELGTEDEQKSKKGSGNRKKVKKTSQPKKAPK